MQQEIMSLGDPDTSNAIMAVLGAAPASSAWGAVVRPVWSSTGADQPVRPVFSSTNTDNPVRAVLSSTAADNPVAASPAAGSTWATRPLQSSAADLQMTATPVAGSTWNVRPLQSSAADLQMTATPVAGSTWNTRPLQSSAADLQMTATIGGNLQSTAAPSSGSSGLVVRTVVDLPLTAASTNALASTLFAINSTAAGQRCKVFAYSITSTVQTPTKVSFYGGSSLKWPVVLAAFSSGITGANLAVSPPAYLFGCAAGSSMTLRTPSSVAGFKVAVAYFMSP